MIIFNCQKLKTIVFCVLEFPKAQLFTSFMIKKKTFHSVSAHHSQSPQALSCSPQQHKVSGDGFSQEEVSKLFPAQHSLHFEGVG